MPLELHDISNATVFHLVAWLLLAFVVVLLGRLLAMMLFGDRRKSPLDRGGTWIARQLKDDDGKPLVERWETPSPVQKALSSLYFVGGVAVMIWLAVSFMHVR